MADAYISPLRNRAGVQTGWRVRWRDRAKRLGRSFALDDKALAERFRDEVRASQDVTPRVPRARRRRASGTLAEFFATGYGSKVKPG